MVNEDESLAKGDDNKGGCNDSRRGLGGVVEGGNSVEDLDENELWLIILYYTLGITRVILHYRYSYIFIMNHYTQSLKTPLLEYRSSRRFSLGLVLKIWPYCI